MRLEKQWVWVGGAWDNHRTVKDKHQLVLGPTRRNGIEW